MMTKPITPVSTPAVRTAIVTGASRGIGRAIAMRLAQDGDGVGVDDSGNQASAADVVADIRAAGGQAVAVQADVSNGDDVRRLFREGRAALGAIDAIVHSAGVMSLAPISPDHVDVFDRMVNTNLRGAFLVLAQAAQDLTQGGRIIAISTSVIAKAFPNYGAYIASKAGVEGLVHVLANELRGRGITVNAVAPGPVATELFMEGKSQAQIAELSNMVPLQRLGTPQDIANAVSFLAGPDGGWINGQVLRANGGFA